MSLATLDCRKHMPGSPAKAGLMLHDLHLEFCHRQVKRNNSRALWHSRLLNGYLKAPAAGIDSKRSYENGHFLRQRIFAFTPRPWWSETVSDDSYVHQNITRHLVSADMEIELAALLLDVRWTHFREREGGILALKSDFEYLIRNMMSKQLGDTDYRDVQHSFELILKAIHVSWGRISEGLRGFLFQLCGRLLGGRNVDPILHFFLRSVEKYTPRPYLLPATPLLPDIRSAQIMEIVLTGDCLTVAYSFCGRYIGAGAGNEVVVADSTTGDILQKLKCHTNLVRCLSFGEESKRLYSESDDGTIVVWEWQSTDRPLHILRGHIDWVACIAIGSDGRSIISGSCDCSLRIWDATTGEQIREFWQTREVYSVHISTGSRTAAIGLADGLLKIIDLCTGAALLKSMKGVEERVTSALSPNGLHFAMHSYSNTIQIWNTQSWEPVGESLHGHEDWVYSLEFSPDGTKIASGSADGRIRLWDVETGRLVGSSPKLHSIVYSVAFSPDGKRIVSGYRNGIVRVWDSELDKEVMAKSSGHTLSVVSLGISRDGLRVISGSRDGTARLWNSKTGASVGDPFRGHTNSVFAVSVSPDGRHAASGSADNTLRLWDTLTSKQIGPPLTGHTDVVMSCCFSFDGLQLVSSSLDKTVRIWDLKAREQFGDPPLGHTRDIFNVSESSDGCYILSQDDNEATFIWNRRSAAIIWKSEKCQSGQENEICDDEARKIIRNCGQDMMKLWPKSFPRIHQEL